MRTARGLAFRGDPRSVVRDDTAPYYGAVIEERTLVPVEGAHLSTTTLEEWLPLNPAPTAQRAAAR